MIRHSDLFRVSLKKTFVRFRWTLLTMMSLSLGLIVFISSSSLLGGVRELFVRTIMMEVVQESPRVILLKNQDPDRPPEEGVPERRILEEDLDAIRAIRGIEDASPHRAVWPVTLKGLRLETYEGVSSPIGVTDAFLKLNVAPGIDLETIDDAVPIFIGQYTVQSRYNAARKRFVLDPAIENSSLIGTDVELEVGDNETYYRPYNRVWKNDHYVIEERGAEELAEMRRQRNAHLALKYELNLHHRALKLKGRIIGIAQGHDCYIPLDVALKCERWIELRNQLSLLQSNETAGSEAEPPGYEEVQVLAKVNVDPQVLLEPLRKLGFYPQTRKDRIDEGMVRFDQATAVICYVFAGLGSVIFLTSCMFVFITTSKVIADSQMEIGLLRALGATRLEIMRIYLLKSSFLGLGGIVLGVSGGYGLAYGISTLAMGYARETTLVWQTGTFGLSLGDVLPPTIFHSDPWVGIAASAAALLAGLLAGWIPARRAANLDPISALRNE